MDITPALNFEKLAAAAVNDTRSWFGAAAPGVTEMIVADYEQAADFTRSFNRIAKVHSAAAAMSVFAYFLKTDVVMAMYKALQEEQATKQ